MKRINLVYGGNRYSIANRDISALQAEIAAAVVSLEPHWLEVNEGEGSRQPARLLITGTTEIALLPIEEPSSEDPAVADGYRLEQPLPIYPTG